MTTSDSHSGSSLPVESGHKISTMALNGGNQAPHLALPIIKKRSGDEVTFDLKKITDAIWRAMQSEGEGSLDEAGRLADLVLNELVRIKMNFRTFVPDVEGVQDIVEQTLIYQRYVKTAKAYILYRQSRSALRKRSRHFSEHYNELSTRSRAYFRSPYNEFVYIRTYARWIESESRRETWIETVGRYMDFMQHNLGNKLTSSEYAQIREAILHQDVMPSMRLMQFSGIAAETTNVCAYNCAFVAPMKLDDFAEVMYVLMCGTGVGFSVEDQNIHALPQIKLQTGFVHPTFVIPDSREGWCDALKIGMKIWYNGDDIEFDYSQCRPAGSRLKTFGGKASGSGPLRDLLDFVRSKVKARQGSRLTSIEAHDILCKIGEIVVSGGVRRSAMISLSDLDDSVMRDAKSGPFYYTRPQRIIANNSAVYKSKPSDEELLEEWLALVKSGSGERGIFNRESLIRTLPERRLRILEASGDIVNGRIVGILGTNPCGEIILRSKQFCNLTEVIGRADDDIASLEQKVKIATIIGTYQATLTSFPYLSPDWQRNCEKERLLGVSLTGQWDCEALRDQGVLHALKAKAIEVNQEFSRRFDIPHSSAITCVKPSGNVSQVVDCSSGMHPRFSQYYVRRVRIASTDSLFKMLKDQGIPFFPEVGQSADSATTFVLEFPVKSPASSIFQHDISALAQLEHWKLYKEAYTEHNPSVTVYVDDHEWIEVLTWLKRHWDIIGGLTFLPKSNHVYQLAPYESITEERYNEMSRSLTKLDFSRLPLYEFEDETEIKKELACAGTSCELH